MPHKHSNQNERNSQLFSETDAQMANYLVKNTSLSVSDAARLIIELLETMKSHVGSSNNETVNFCRHVIHMGIRAYEDSLRTVSFSDAVVAVLEYKNSARARTISEIRQICTRIMKNEPEWITRGMREFDRDYCQRTIVHVFPTVSMQRKVKRVLHSIFNFSMLNGWSAHNPLDLVVLPPYVERPIQAMRLNDIYKLLEAASLPKHRICAGAVGLMLWAGIRPSEVQRLKYKDLDFEENVITVPAIHSKTGGARHVTMYPALRRWIKAQVPNFDPEANIVPQNWTVRWAKLRREAGFTNWVQDILRHTFASYHLKHFKNISTLMQDMGHSTLQQLRTRYLAMENLTQAAAKAFWDYGLKRPKH